MRVKTLLVILFILVLPDLIFGQCSMCRLMAESSYESGSQIGRGLNDGIGYIMGIPYIILIVGGIILFRKKVPK